MTEGHRTTQASPGLQRPIQRRRTNLRRRYMLVTSGLMAVLLAVLGVGFAADSGTSNVTIDPADDGILVHVPGGSSVPAAVTLKHGSVSSGAEWTTVKSPTWDVAVGTAGSVAPGDAGDLAYFDAAGATSTTALVSVYVTNMEALAANYTSWMFNVGMQPGSAAEDAAPGLTTEWGAAVPEVVTSDSGAISFVIDLETSNHWSLSLDAGGSFYTVQDGTTGSLSPSFFIRVTQL